jgi:site-specific DNA-cytosine methylase
MDIEKKLKQKRKASGFCKHTPSQRSLSMRPNGKGWQFVKTEEGRLAWIRIRKLTPREAFRLMDVDEHYIDKIQAAGISDSQQYRMAGNSICVCVMEKGIFYNLFSEEETYTETLF